MENNIKFKRVTSFWDKVHVDEITQFSDTRGMVSEVFRLDDLYSSESKQCYISETKPFVMRGPHQHSVNGVYNDCPQTDNFISWNNKMVYYFFNEEKNEGAYFITEKNKIYRLIVPPPIIHSYTNIESKIAMTLNFPTALFMGKDKKCNIDEVRHEDKLHGNVTYVVIGAEGRLGKSLVDELYKNMGFHKYNVIPIYDIFNNENEVKVVFEEITRLYQNIKVINCAALTDTKKYSKPSEELTWVNVQLPTILDFFCHSAGIPFYQISTDYVFRENDDNAYTNSKKLMEECLKYNKHANIIRVANLFSLEKSDLSNIVTKLKHNIDTQPSIYFDSNVLIFPTETRKLSKNIINFIEKNTCFEQVNIYGKPYKVDDFLKTFYKEHVVYQKDSGIVQNAFKFMNGILLDCDEEIKTKIL